MIVRNYFFPRVILVWFGYLKQIFKKKILMNQKLLELFICKVKLMIPSDPLPVPTKNWRKVWIYRSSAEGSHGQFHQQISSDKEHNISQFFATGWTLQAIPPEPVIWQLTGKWSAEPLQILKTTTITKSLPRFQHSK